MTTKESFAESVYVLWQYRRGYDNCLHSDDYRDGFFMAFEMWLSGAYDKTYYAGDLQFDARKGFRNVVDAYKRLNTESDRFEDGYLVALRMFQEAKGL